MRKWYKSNIDKKKKKKKNQSRNIRILHAKSWNVLLKMPIQCFMWRDRTVREVDIIYMPRFQGICFKQLD